MNPTDKLTEQFNALIQEGVSSALEENRRDFEMRLIQIEEIGWKPD